MQEKQKKIKSAENVDLEEFYKHHTVTEYEVDKAQFIHFKIDGAKYCLSPIYVGSGMAANYPAGNYVSLRPVGAEKAKQLFSYYFYTNNRISDRYSQAYEMMSKEIKQKYPDAKAQDYVPYIVYRMVAETFLHHPKVEYWEFLHHIDLDANRIGSLVAGLQPVSKQKEYIHSHTESLKSLHPWIQMETDVQRLFECIVEHFIRYANTELNDRTYDRQYIQDMNSLLTFIQKHHTCDFIKMIQSYPDMDMQEECQSPFFDNTVFALKAETAAWVKNHKSLGITLDDAVLRNRQNMLELFAAKYGINIRGRRFIGYPREDKLTHYHTERDIAYNGAKNISAPGIEEIKSKIKSSYYGYPNMRLNEKYEDAENWSLNFTVPYCEETYQNIKYDAEIEYYRRWGIGKDDIIRDYVNITLIPKYTALDEESICFITKDVLGNGFQIKSSQKKISTVKDSLPYDSGWIFTGDKQDEEYINNNLVTVNFEALKKLCDIQT